VTASFTDNTPVSFDIQTSVNTFKALHNQAPTYLTDLFTYYQPPRLLRSSTKNLLWNPTYNLKSYGGCSFAVAAASVWNALRIRQSVKDSASGDIF